MTDETDDALTGNGEASGDDLVMQWGVRWPDGRVRVESSLEAAQVAVDFWAARSVPCDLVSRVCGPWQ